MSAGFIYIFSNPSMVGILKVGMSSRVPDIRVADPDLNSTGVPTPFEVEYYAFFDNMRSAEQEAHIKLKRYHYSKEYFKLSIEEAVAVIENLSQEAKRLYLNEDSSVKISLDNQKTMEKELEIKQARDIHNQMKIESEFKKQRTKHAIRQKRLENMRNRQLESER